MPPDALQVESGFAAGANGLTADWRTALIRLGIAWTVLFALFASDWAAMIAQWWNISTYNHMLLIPPIIAWLVHQRARQVAQLEPLCWWPGLIAVALATVLWALGALAGLDLFRQAGAVALIAASVLLLLGPKVFAGLLFPLFYLVFLIPFGEEFVPALQMITAALTIAMVKASGIPAAIDGVFIETPAGLFEVAEACSGVMFLVAMIALGALVANVGFRTWPRRAAFMSLCVVAPILANGVRAFGTVFAAQHVGAERAAGIDHLIYGWVFFALVIALILGLSWRFFDRGIDDPMIDPTAIADNPMLTALERQAIAPLWAGIALLGLIGAGLGWAHTADRQMARLPRQIDLPAVPGWHRVDYAPRVAWQPRAGGADHHLLGRYADAGGRQVDVFFALYAAQSDGKEAGGFGEGALREGSGWSWLGEGAALADAKSDRLRHETGVERLAVTSYRTGDLLTGSNAALKLANIRDRALLRPRTTMLLIVSSEQRFGASAAADVAAFRQAAGNIGPWMDRIAAGR